VGGTGTKKLEPIGRDGTGAVPDERVPFDAEQRSMAGVHPAQSTSSGRNVNGGTQPAVPVTGGHGLVTSVDCLDSTEFDGDAKCSETKESMARREGLEPPTLRFEA
jgi:hypothetical protein